LCGFTPYNHHFVLHLKTFHYAKYMHSCLQHLFLHAVWDDVMNNNGPRDGIRMSPNRIEAHIVISIASTQA